MNRLDIAVHGDRGIGDGLIFCVLANNLSLNGHNVTLFNDNIVSLSKWFPNFKIKPFQGNSYSYFLDSFDLCITNQTEYAGKALIISNVRNKRFLSDNDLSEINKKFSAYLKAKIKDKEKLKSALILSNANFTFLPKISRYNTLVKSMTILCREYLKLKYTTTDCGISPPSNLTFKKYNSRVIIHPTSTDIISKNWSSNKFLELAVRLKSKGYDPVFTVAPNEREEWLKNTRNNFEVPLFKDISKLAEFIYESRYMIGNDSGVGHLASSLGLPTLIITSSGTSFFRWRPGWSYCKVVNFPKIKFRGKVYWKEFISVKRVLRNFLKIAKKY